MHPQAEAEKRAFFLNKLKSFEKENRKIIYLDESGFKGHDNRAYGYAQRGKPCLSQYNWSLKNQSNAIGAVFNQQLFAVGLYDCSINSDVFHGWVKEVLLPQLPDNSVIVMDNATFHKRSDTKALIEAAGHTILWLPPYSPDLNPIEHTWAWIKQKRKEWRLNCIDRLFFYFMWLCGDY